MFDAGLLGEGILPTLLHAWENLLLPPPQSEVISGRAGIVIPYSATVWVAAIQCIHIARRLVPQFSFCQIQMSVKQLYN